LQVYNPDGSKLVASVAPERACHNTGTKEEPDLTCYFSDVVSDGHKYVWATVRRGEDKIEVFNIDSGAFVGSFLTCGSPQDLDFLEGREELWVHCSDYSEMEQSHMDVFSTITPAVPITTRVLLHDNTEARSYGKLEDDDTLGDVGYATVYGQNFIYKIDLAQRVVSDQIEVSDGNQKLNGLYEMAYSPVNQHLFLRTQVCCTCGFAGADNLECGQYGSTCEDLYITHFLTPLRGALLAQRHYLQIDQRHHRVSGHPCTIMEHPFSLSWFKLQLTDYLQWNCL